MQERAKAQGKTLPEMPPAGYGPGGGMGPAAEREWGRAEKPTERLRAWPAGSLQAGQVALPKRSVAAKP